MSAAVKQKNLALADSAANKIDSKLRRAFVMQSVALYVFGSDDLGRAGERLIEAAKLINSTDNDIEKATALLRSIPVVSKIDKQMVPETMQAAIKVVNNLPGLQSAEKPAAKVHQERIEAFLQIAYNVIPAFRSFAQNDELEALTLAGKLQSNEIRSSAILGVITGISEDKAGKTKVAGQ